jgi:hypothetical protein
MFLLFLFSYKSILLLFFLFNKIHFFSRFKSHDMTQTVHVGRLNPKVRDNNQYKNKK